MLYSGPVHTYRDIFENGDFFSPFSEKYASTRSVFESFSPVHTKTHWERAQCQRQLIRYGGWAGPHDWYGKSNGSVPESYNAVEKILKFVEEGGWKHEVFSQEYPIDVTDVFDPESTEGNLLLDFLTHSKNFRGTADEEVVNETLALIKDLSTIKDGRHFGKLTEYLIFIYK